MHAETGHTLELSQLLAQAVTLQTTQRVLSLYFAESCSLHTLCSNSDAHSVSRVCTASPRNPHSGYSGSA